MKLPYGVFPEDAGEISFSPSGLMQIKKIIHAAGQKAGIGLLNPEIACFRQKFFRSSQAPGMTAVERGEPEIIGIS
jgi:hypothetical protein